MSVHPPLCVEIHNMFKVIPFLWALTFAMVSGCSWVSPADPPSTTIATAHVHDVEGETCFICDPSKRDAGRLWCQEHSRYEDRCWDCQPQLRDADRAYCEEHSLYEDECFLCNPALADDPSAGGKPPTASPPTAHGHGAGETCFICDPSKRDPGRLWCKEHDRYEDRCWDCQPQLRDADRAYCDEHGLYEDECTLCGRAQDKALEGASGDASGALDAGGLFCNEHQVPEHQCGICQPQLAAGLPPGESLLVRLPSERSAELAGLSMGRPSLVDAHEAATLLGEVRYDGNRLARVTPLADGVISAVHVDVGEVVRAGEMVATVNSPAMAEAKGRYLVARHTEQLTAKALERKEQIQLDGIGSQRALDEARTAHDRARVEASIARQGLLDLGLREREVEDLGDDASSTLPLRAPFAGTIVSRTAVLGSAVTSGETLVEIADLSQMWIELSVPEEVATGIGVGTEVELRVRSSRGAPVLGNITWVGPVVDERTRLVRARAVVPNPEGMLRQGMFADVTALLENLPGSVRLPSSAVHRVGDLPFVFVQEEDDLFEARRVEVGDRLDDDHLVVTAGIGSSDAVVMDGGFTLKSALLASRLGAGCADD